MNFRPLFKNRILVVVLVTGLLTQIAWRQTVNIRADPLLLNIIAIAASENHTCALTAGGAVRCWGDNFYGQLGDGTTTDRNSPVWVSGLSGVTAITAGRFHTCALTSGGGVKCWGANGDGQLGNGSNNASHIPVDVSNLASGVTAIAAGGYHTCARTSLGGMKCWGNNYDGQLGDDTTTDRLEPVSIFVNGISSITAGWAHTCAVTTTGGAKCWGNNIRGQLGDGTTDEHHSPVNVSGLINDVSAISAGGFHTCALVGGIIKCWGWNFYGQLGDTTTGNHTSPVNVFWLASTPSAISAGGNHTCALNTDGGVKCWGWNFYGQLGDDSTDQRTAPVEVNGLAGGVSAISTGHIHSCALMAAGGGVKCWGYNADGQLGDGTNTDSHIPVDVVSPRLTFRSVAGRDGWVLESTENSNEGGSLNSDGNLVAGDNASDRQYRSFLYFNTGGLPDNATILSVTLKIRLLRITGTDPFTTHGQLLADINTGSFGAGALEVEDFQAVASRNNIGHFTLVSGSADWYKITMGAGNFVYINLTGVTQFRLRFATGDNDDLSADYLTFYSGDSVTASSRPTLIIEYYVP